MGLGASFLWPGALAAPGMAGEASVLGASAGQKAFARGARNYVDLSTLRPPRGAVV